MSNLNSLWEQYLAIQTKLRDAMTVNDTSWGYEAALDRILGSDGLPRADDVERAASSGSRRERHRARLRRQYLGPEDCLHGEDALHARQNLRLVRREVSDEEWALLVGRGMGTSYSELGALVAVNINTLRVRMQRLRQRVSPLVAAVGS